jgi:hypothetical protein
MSAKHAPSNSSIVQRVCLGAFFLLAIACAGGGDGGADAVSPIHLRLERGGSTTTTLQPNSAYTLRLRATCPAGALHFTVNFAADSAHFDPIPPMEIVGFKGTTDFDVTVHTLAQTGTGQITMTVTDKDNLTVEPLNYTIAP